MKPLFFLFVLFLNFSVYSQGAYVPLNTESYRMIDRFDIRYNKILPIPHSSVKPYNRAAVAKYAEVMYNSNIDLKKADIHNLKYLMNDNAEWVDSFSTKNKPLLKFFYREKASLLHVSTKAFELRINPVVDFEYGAEFGNKPVYMSSKGFELRATLMKKLSLYTFLTDNQTRLPSFMRTGAIKGRFANLPENAYWKEFKDEGQDYFKARGYLSFNVLKHIDVQFGYDKQFIGNGYRSLYLSDNAAPFLFLKTNLKVWKINYQSIWGEMIGQYKRGGDRLLDKKYAVFHHLSFNVTKWLDVGVFEGVSLTRSNQFEWHYLIPIIFYRSIEQSLGSADNSVIGLDFKANFLRHFQLYGQFVLDEFNFSHIRANDKWWANKFGVQAGVKYIDVANVPNLDLQLEFNMVMPYTYTHYSKPATDSTEGKQIANYTHYNQALAHPLGANFTEFVGLVNYQPVQLPNLNISLKYINAVVGVDSMKLDGTLTNYGGDIFTATNGGNTVENEFGNYLRQGNAHRINMFELKATYQFWHNMYGILKVGTRSLNSDIDWEDNTSTWFSLGVRINASNRNWHF
jgi:hypothetical protein